MITVEKLEKGTYFDDAFKISFRYDPTTVAKVKQLPSLIRSRLLIMEWRKTLYLSEMSRA